MLHNLDFFSLLFQFFLKKNHSTPHFIFSYLVKIKFCKADIPMNKFLIKFIRQNNFLLKKQFKITKKQIDSIYSNKPLEDILSEKAAILF